MTLLEERTYERPMMVVARPAPRMPRLRRAMLVLIGVLLPTGAVGIGTVASFSGSGDNASTLFTVGTLVLSNTVDGANACLSTSGPGGMTINEAECDGLFTLDVSRPGDGTSVDIDLANVGSMDADLAVHAAGACANGDADDTIHHGTGDLCNGLLLSIQSYTSAVNRDDDITTGGSCIYGGGTAEACAFDDVDDTAAAFTAAHGDFDSTLAMGEMQNDGATSVRFLRVSVLLPEDAGNTYQGRTAEFGLTWRLVQ